MYIGVKFHSGLLSGYVYIVKSDKHDRYYIGSTNNLARRLKEHLGGKSYFIKRYMCEVKLVFYQKYEDIHIARMVEMWLKKQKSRVLVERIINEGKIEKTF